MKYGKVDAQYESNQRPLSSSYQPRFQYQTQQSTPIAHQAEDKPTENYMKSVGYQGI